MPVTAPARRRDADRRSCGDSKFGISSEENGHRLGIAMIRATVGRRFRLVLPAAQVNASTTEVYTVNDAHKSGRG